MRKILFEDQSLDCLESESVLDTLLRHGADIAWSCKTGLCQSCLLRASKGKLSEECQRGLKPNLREQNYFLPCTCHPHHDLEISRASQAEIFGHAIVHSKHWLAKDICRIRLETPNELFYHAGQFINLRRDDGLVRSYSLASVSQLDDYLEIHVKRMQNGRMSNWLCDEVKIDQVLQIQGACGNCFYSQTNLHEKMLLIGAGTGLSPLLGISRDALQSGHLGDIYLYHGSRNTDGLYYHEHLQQLTQQHINFNYFASLSSSENSPAGISQGSIEDIALHKHKDLKDWQVYICGYPEMVNTTKFKAYLAGAEIADIFADPFELTDLRKLPRP